ncbi:type II CAAX endopeptidase family protein [Halorarum salinum]|uniref:CPBP family intramembrane metalloprotease n=1 Tax=Halorarum salinum TaxID=2743089 RepID=A0A7D5QIQ5_9EURY|nr:type II CAAX endopeptidase family protein [Halobaculum salinum]QLG60885.1 CPBP family intramembrane metalloprotease [Halobaculum salinum]
MRSASDVRSQASFVVLTFAFSWTVWGAGYLLAEGGTRTTLLLMLGGFGPAFGAVVRLRLEGRSVRTWLRGRMRFRVGARWYLVALAVPVAFAAVHTVSVAVRGGPLAPSVLVDRAPTFALAVLVTAFVGGGQEEFGWRGYLLPWLQDDLGPFVASLVLGVVWAVWHLPLYVVPGAYNWGEPFGLYVPVVVGFAVVFTWLFNRVGGALPALILLHAAVNSSGLLVPASRSTLAGVAGTPEYLVQFVAVVAVVLAVLAVDGFDLGLDAGVEGAAGPGASAADAEEREPTRA